MVQGVHGWNAQSYVPDKGYIPHEHRIERTPLGTGYLGKGMYFSVMDTSGVKAQLECYNYRTGRALANLHICKPVVVRDVDRQGASSSWMMQQFHEAVSTKPWPREDGWGSREYRDWLFKTARRKGYDAFVYLTDNNSAGPEHGSQIAVLNMGIIEVLDWNYNVQPELERLRAETRGWE